MRHYLVELVGTFALILTAVVTLGRGEPLAAPAVGAVLVAALALGAGDDAGSRPHLNPAVTLGATIQGRLHVADLVPYWAAQLTGALLGAVLGMWVTAIPAGTTLSGQELVRAGAVELALTFVIVLVALLARADHHPLAVGLAMAAGLLVAVPVSGGALNPALAFGAAVSGLGTWSSIWALLAATVTGGALAGLAAGQLSSRPG